MIYKVVFRRQDHNGLQVMESKFKGVEKIEYLDTGGVHFVGQDGLTLAYFSPGTIIYLEKVEVPETSPVIQCECKEMPVNFISTLKQSLQRANSK